MKRKSRGVGSYPDERAALVIMLAFDHPSIDPEEISRHLGIKPSTAAMAGSHYVDVHGNEVPARHRWSKWKLYRDFLPSARELDDVPSAIGDALTMLEQHASFVMRVADEGSVLIGLQFNGAAYRAIALPFDLLRRMAKLHVTFAMEVFPHGLG